MANIDMRTYITQNGAMLGHHVYYNSNQPLIQIQNALQHLLHHYRLSKLVKHWPKPSNKFNIKINVPHKICYYLQCRHS